MSHARRFQSPVDDRAMGRVPSQLRRSCQALVALMAGLALAGSAGFLVNLRSEMIRDAEMRATAGARLLEEHVLRTFRASEFILDRVVALGRSAPIPQLAKSRAAFDDLSLLTSGLPEPGALWITTATGRIALGSPQFPTPPSDMAGRYYFNAHLEQSRGLVIGPLVATQSGDLQAFHLSKRIEADDGTLLGVAAAGFDAPYFTDFYRSLALGPHSALSIIAIDGRVVMRQPEPERWVDASVAGGPVLKAAATAPGGIVHSRSPLDGVERITAYRTVERYGVVVLSSMALEDALRDWWRVAAVIGAILAGTGLLLGITAHFAFRSLRHEEDLMRGLERRTRAQTEEALLRAEEAHLANATKTRFLAAASHDLRQPLQAAGMFVEALAARLGGSPHAAILDKLRQSVDATQALLSTLLDVSALEAGRVEAHPTAFPLAPIMATLADQMEPEAALAGLRLHVVPTDAWVVSDPILLERMLRNLLVNALRYTGMGGVLLGCRRRGDMLAIQVIDSGCGIPADMQQAIFDDFTRLGDKGSGPTRGLGLGLSVVRRMAALMGHGLELASTVGRGSVFGIVVPRAQRPNGVEAGSASSRVMAANEAPSTSP